MRDSAVCVAHPEPVPFVKLSLWLACAFTSYGLCGPGLLTIRLALALLVRARDCADARLPMGLEKDQALRISGYGRP